MKDFIVPIALLGGGYLLWKSFSAAEVVTKVEKKPDSAGIQPKVDLPAKPDVPGLRDQMSAKTGGQPASFNWWAQFYQEVTGKTAPSVSDPARRMVTVDEWLKVAFPNGVSGLGLVRRRALQARRRG